MTSVDIYGDKELIRYLDKSIKDLKPQLLKGLKESAELVESESKKKLGTYQRGWPKLKLATVIAKYKRRKVVGMSRSRISGVISSVNIGLSDDPLILHGNLKDSISHEIIERELEAVIFSDEKHAAVQEFGYAPKNIPARSYLRLTLWDEEDAINRIIDRRMGEIF